MLCVNDGQGYRIFTAAVNYFKTLVALFVVWATADCSKANCWRDLSATDIATQCLGREQHVSVTRASQRIMSWFEILSMKFFVNLSDCFKVSILLSCVKIVHFRFYRLYIHVCSTLYLSYAQSMHFPSLPACDIYSSVLWISRPAYILLLKQDESVLAVSNYSHICLWFKSREANWSALSE